MIQESTDGGAPDGEAGARHLRELSGVGPLDRRRENRGERFERTKAEIAARVARVCASWSAGDLDALVTHMAEVEIKYERRRRNEALMLVS